MTDLEGKIRDEYFNEGIDSLTPNADIRVICQNPILRVLDGNLANIGVYQDVSIADGDTVNLNTPAEQMNHYNILDRAHIAYEVVFRPLSFFANFPDPDFPLGRKSSLRATRDQAKRIDLSFPDQFLLSPLSFTEPKRLNDDFPLMHIKSNDNRVFGTGGEAPTLISHELAHAFHFSKLTKAQRGRAQDKYLEFILASPISGVGPFHDFTMRTTPEVAYIEAAGWFSELFMEFMRARQGGGSTLVRPEPITSEIHAEFVASEWLRVTESFFRIITSSVLRPWWPTPAAVPRFSRPIIYRGVRRPTVTGGDKEGAVYSAIFVDFAGLVGLDFAASTYFEANALNFGEYRNFVNQQHPNHAAALETVRIFWGL
ncbi:MAG: hypothetical protein ACREC0_14635 [Methylocella sp.]